MNLLPKRVLQVYSEGMGQKCCSLVSRFCTCLSCGKGRYTVRFVHTALCIGIPVNIIYNKHSDLNKWLVEHQGSFVFGFTYLGLVLASLIFYFAACLTDPGYIDQSTIMQFIEDEEAEEELFVSRSGQPSGDITRAGYTVLRSSNPQMHQPSQRLGEAAATRLPAVHLLSDDSEVELEIEDMTDSSSRMLAAGSENGTCSNDTTTTSRVESSEQDEATVRMCKICNIPQPLRSRHCSDCKKCVLKYDHHCPWLSTCVGEKNHKFFWLFLLFISLVVVSTLVLTVRGFPSHKTGATDFPMSDVADMLFTIFNGIVLVVAVLSALPLFGFHSYLMITNQTTWESVSRSKITYLRRLSEDTNPFHLGYCRNVSSFFCRCAPYKWNAIYKRSASTQRLNVDIQS